MTAQPIPPLHVDTGPRTAAGVLADLEAGLLAERHAPALGTGFEPLDTVMGGGIHPGDLTLIGGNPGIGKTILALQWARNWAASGTDVVFASFEHDERELLGRLLLLEIGNLAAAGQPSHAEVRRLVRQVITGAVPLDELLPGSDRLRSAANRLAQYADRLWLLGASSSTTDIAALADAVTAGRDAPAALFVDYLQKVAVAGTIGNGRRTAAVAEALKDLALTEHVPVVAISAGADAGLEARRMRARHLLGSSFLAYEADAIVMLNDKFRAVSNVHTAYDPVGAETFRNQIVLTIEKNRAGPAPLDMEFTKDYEHYRLDPEGAFVSERLIDERFYVE